jgi:hypothetical protein
MRDPADYCLLCVRECDAERAEIEERDRRERDRRWREEDEHAAWHAEMSEEMETKYADLARYMNGGRTPGE